MGRENRLHTLAMGLISLAMAGALALAAGPVYAENGPGDASTEGNSGSAVEDDAVVETAQATESGDESDVQDGLESDLNADFGSAPKPPGTSDSPADPHWSQGVREDAGEIPANSASPAEPTAETTSTTGDEEEYEPTNLGADGGEAGDDETDDSANDPLEGMNRAFFEFNDFLDRLLLKPAAEVYRFILPSYVQDRIRNVVNNADSPVILANDILQWKWERAWNTTSRFFINTTIGVGGIWDVAEDWGIDRHTEDFGQTLCVWGVSDWLYLYLPFVGPTNPRDIAGGVVDRYFDPLTYYGDIIQQVNLSDGVHIKWNVDRAGMAKIALAGADLIDMRARNIETINEIERTSIDFYTAVRSLYRQSRESACNDGQVDFEELPDLSEEFE